MKTETIEIGRELFSINGPLDVNIRATLAIFNRSGQYDISLRLLKIFGKGTEIKSVIIINILT